MLVVVTIVSGFCYKTFRPRRIICTLVNICLLVFSRIDINASVCDAWWRADCSFIKTSPSSEYCAAVETGLSAGCLTQWVRFLFVHLVPSVRLWVMYCFRCKLAYFIRHLKSITWNFYTGYLERDNQKCKGNTPTKISSTFMYLSRSFFSCRTWL